MESTLKRVIQTTTLEWNPLFWEWISTPNEVIPNMTPKRVDFHSTALRELVKKMMFLCTLATKWAKISSIYSKITKLGGHCLRIFSSKPYPIIMFKDFSQKSDLLERHTPDAYTQRLSEYPPPPPPLRGAFTQHGNTHKYTVLRLDKSYSFPIWDIFYEDCTLREWASTMRKGKNFDANSPYQCMLFFS